MRQVWLAWIIGLAALASCAARPALAGTAKVYDGEGVLGVDGTNRVEAAAQALPFDAIVVTSVQQDIGAYIAQQVEADGRAYVAGIGLDTVHRKVRVVIGPGLYAAQGALDDASRRGVGAFKQGRWADGLVNVIEGVNAVVTPTRAEVVAEQVATAATSESPSGLPWLLVVMGAFVAGVCVWAIIKVRRMNREEEIALGRRARAYDTYGDVSEFDDSQVIRPGLGRRYVPNDTSHHVPLAGNSGVVVVERDSAPSLVDWAVADSIIHHHSDPAPAPAPSYTPPAPSYTPAPSHHDSGSSGWGGSSSGGSDLGGSSFGGGDFGGGSSGGSDF